MSDLPFIGNQRLAQDENGLYIEMYDGDKWVRSGRVRQMLQDEIKRLRARVAALETLRRFGTPFDPTGAKTGTEIMSLRGRVESLEKENVVLRRKLNPDALEDDSLDALLKENEALRTRVEMAEDMYLAQHASTDPYIRGLETRVRAAEARATELGRMNQTLADRITALEDRCEVVEKINGELIDDYEPLRKRCEAAEARVIES